MFSDYLDDPNLSWNFHSQILKSPEVSMFFQLCDPISKHVLGSFLLHFYTFKASAASDMKILAS